MRGLSASDGPSALCYTAGMRAAALLLTLAAFPASAGQVLGGDWQNAVTASRQTEMAKAHAAPAPDPRDADRARLGAELAAARLVREQALLDGRALTPEQSDRLWQLEQAVTAARRPTPGQARAFQR